MKKVRSTILILALSVTVVFSAVSDECVDTWAAPNQITTDLIYDASEITDAINILTAIDDIGNPFERLTVYPNPSNDIATVDFELTERADVKIQVLNMLGQNVLNVFEGSKFPGSHQQQMNVTKLQPGTYLIRVTAGKNVRTIRFAKSMK